VRPTCDNAILNKDGTCKPCDLCESLNEAKTGCVAPKCDARSVLEYNGNCLECQEYFRPVLVDEKQCGATCQTCTPAYREIRLKSGLCEKCQDYYKISDDQLTCSPVVCKDNSYVTIDGLCTPCGEYTRVDSSRRKCITTPCLDN